MAQASSTIRNLHSTVIIQGTQQEQNNIQTRTVTNHNHCLDFMFSELRVKFNTGQEGTNGDVHVTLKLNDGRQIRCSSTERTNQGPYELRKPGEPTFWSNREDWFTLRPDEPVRWGDISSIEFRLSWVGADVNINNWRLSHFYMEGRGTDGSGRIFDGNIDHLFVTREPDTLVYPVSVTLPQQSSTTIAPRFQRAEEMLSVEERCCINRLINHLNNNKVYYNNAIRMMGDCNENILILEGYQRPGDQGRLIDYIENRPLGAVGTYIVFPTGIDNIPDGDGVRIHDGNGERKLGSAERVISLPTRGLFAEAKLSNCSSCEERDITRFWDWSQSPCPEKPPEITDIHPESHAIQPALQPTNLPNPVVNIVNPPNAPDPTGLAGAMNLLATANIFRDMSGIQQVGSLLNTLVQAVAPLDLQRVLLNLQLVQLLLALELHQMAVAMQLPKLRLDQRRRNNTINYKSIAVQKHKVN